MLTFTIAGTPAPQGSKRHVGRGIMVESSKRLPAWREKMHWHLKSKYHGEPLDLPLEVTAVFYLPRPKRPKFWAPATTPDCDKLQRALGDALTSAGVIKDDSRIVTWHATKAWHPTGFTGVHIEIKELK